MAVKRRDSTEFERAMDEQNELTYGLCEQENFIGTEDDLKKMRSYERAYMDGHPKISDEEWEILKRKHNYDESITCTAPSGRQYVKMQAPLPSMAKAGTIDEVRQFCLGFPGRKWLVEPKLDGLTANAIYRYEKIGMTGRYVLDCVTSRGNGRYGLKLWDHALDGVQVNGLPSAIPVSVVQDITGGYEPDVFELRGEAVIRKTKESINHYSVPSECSINGFEPVVWSSIVSGMFNRKVPSNLPGLLSYLYNGMTLKRLVHERGTHVDGHDGLLFVPDVVSDARLIASLTSDTHPYLRTSSLMIHEDGCVEIIHRDGETWRGYVYKEEFDFVTFSAAINGVNVDKPEELRKIPGTKYVLDVQWLDDDLRTVGPMPMFGVTSDVETIIQWICMFYGCDGEGKRVESLPRLRNACEYALDGVCVKLYDSNSDTQDLSIRPSKSGSKKMVVPKYPSDAIACKLLSEIVRVKLDHIERKRTSLGNQTCQGVLDHPYRVERGAMVERVDLHNADWLAENDWIQEGGWYGMVMAMDIKPQLIPI